MQIWFSWAPQKGCIAPRNNLNTFTQYISSTHIKDIEFHPTDSSVIYLYDDKNSGPNEDLLLVSSDIGITFNNSDDFAGNNDKSGYISVSPDCPDCVWFGSDNGIWKSYDKGVNFDFVVNPSQSCDGFTVSDVDSSIMLYGYVDIEMSTNSGTNWTQVVNWSIGTAASWQGGKYVHADLRESQCINGDFYVATDGLLSKSTNNGDTWQILSTDIGIRENYSLGISQSNHYRSISGSQDNGTSIKHKESWIEFYGADGMEGVVQPLNGDWMIGSWQFGGRRRTQDAGQSGSAVTPTNQDASWVAPMFIDPNQQMHVYSFGKAVYKSEDFGSNWTTLAGSPLGGDQCKEGAIAYNNTQIMAISHNPNIQLSTDGGNTFSSIRGSLPNHTITDIAFAPKDDNTIVVTYGRWQNDGNKVFISTDQGSSWTNITANLPDMPIHSVIIDHTPDQNIYLGAEVGVYTKPMNGTTWTFHNTTLPNVTVRDMEINFGSNTLRVATWGRGLWEYALVGRVDYPAILTTKLDDEVTDLTPVENIPQDVTSVISYDNTLSSVFVKWSANSLLFDQTIVMNNTQDSTWVTQSPIPGQAANTDVYFKVFAVGASGDTSETYKFHYKVHPTCAATGSMISGTAVTLVDFAGIVNGTGKTQPYTDYTASDSAIVEVNGTYAFNLQVNTDGFQNTYGRVWMDWNQNGNFGDIGEEYDLGIAANTTNGPTNSSPYNITIPASAQLGKTTMRVAARRQAIPFPCLTDMNGEVEDYGLYILAEGTGISENINTMEVNAWPNPVTGVLNLDFGKRYSHVEVEVLDLLGAVLRTKGAQGKERMQVDMDGFECRVYLVRIHADGERAVLKVVNE